MCPAPGITGTFSQSEDELGRAQVTSIADGVFVSYCCVTSHPTLALLIQGLPCSLLSCQLEGWLGPNWPRMASFTSTGFWLQQRGDLALNLSSSSDRSLGLVS